MKKIFLTIILGIFLLSFVSPLDSLGKFEQEECVAISQTCASCTYVNISSISNKRNFTLISNVPMSSYGNGEWRYEFCDTVLLGRYDVRGQGDKDAVDSSFATYFEITPSGEGGMENVVFIIFLIIAIYTIALLGFFKHNATITLLGGMAMIFLGIYLINNGIIIYRDNLTNYFSYLTSLLGGGLSIMAAISLMND